jgi:hypothetical protein
VEELGVVRWEREQLSGCRVVKCEDKTGGVAQNVELVVLASELPS